jgi:hypothetical protein
MANPNTSENTGESAERDERGGAAPTEHNKAGHQQPTSRNEPRRTPESRHDRESHVGGTNQVQNRRGGVTR